MCCQSLETFQHREGNTWFTGPQTFQGTVSKSKVLEQPEQLEGVSDNHHFLHGHKMAIKWVNNGEYDDCLHWNPLKDHENPIIENHHFPNPAASTTSAASCPQSAWHSRQH